MQVELAKGVQLHMIPTTKYTTTRILINFATKQTKTNSAVRNVLVNLMVNGAQAFPNQTAIARKLSEMYGAELDGYVVRMGNIHNVRINLTVVNDQVVNQPVAQMALRFLHELIFRPLQNNGVLSPDNWELQKSNLVGTLASWNDDKQYLAAKRLLQLYYPSNSVMQMPSVGTETSVAQVTNADLLTAYQAMIQQNQIDIVVEGNIQPEQYQSAFANWGFADRRPLGTPVFYRQPLNSSVRKETDLDSIQQAKLDMAYHFPVYFMDEDYYPALVMNSLFGASPYSLLFDNVREKASLAYYASSGYRPFEGYLFVQSGINSEDRQRAQSLINQQLMDIQDGKIDERQLTRVKKNLINDYLTAQDNPNQLVERSLITGLMGRAFSTNSVERVENVSQSEVSAIAQQVNLQAIYFLDRR